MGSACGLEVKSPAANIVNDYKINLMTPNDKLKVTPGALSGTFNDNGQIQESLEHIIKTANPQLLSQYKMAQKIFFIGLIVAVTLTIALAITISPILMVLLWVFLFVGIISFSCWSRRIVNQWKGPVLNNIKTYAQMQFKQTFMNLEIHLLYPINEYRSGRNGSRKVAEWLIIRVTQGPLQQPIDGPIYFSTCGTMNGSNAMQQPMMNQQINNQMYMPQPMNVQMQPLQPVQPYQPYPAYQQVQPLQPQSPMQPVVVQNPIPYVSPQQQHMIPQYQQQPIVQQSQQQPSYNQYTYNNNYSGPSNNDFQASIPYSSEGQVTNA